MMTVFQPVLKVAPIDPRFSGSPAGSAVCVTYWDEYNNDVSCFTFAPDADGENAGSATVYPGEYVVPGLAGRAFGLGRLGYASNYFCEASPGYFEGRVILNVAPLLDLRRSVMHTEQSNLDNLYLGCAISTMVAPTLSQVDIMQIAP